MAVQTLIQVRRGSLAEWNSADSVLGAGILYQGEMGYETDTRRFKIGDGSTPWSSLEYAAVIPTGFLAGSGISISKASNGSAVTISLSDPTIQVGDITDFNEGVDDRVSSLLQAGDNISLSYDDNANTLTINSTLGTEEVQDAIGTYLIGGSGITVSYDDSTGYTTVELSDPTIQSTDVTDFVEAVQDVVGSGAGIEGFLRNGSGINLAYNDVNNTVTVEVTGIPSSLITDFTNAVSDTVDTTLSAGTGLSLDYDNNTNTLTVNTSGLAYTQHTHDWTDITDAVSTVTLTELGYLSGVVPGTASANKAVVIDADKNIIGIGNISTTGNITVGGDLTVSGSGLVASNIDDFDTQVRTNRLDQLAAPTADVSLNNNKITNLATPTSDNDAATKAYVDAARSGLDVKQSVRVATTENITLSGTQTIDGVVLVAGDRVLVKDQSTASENGIYIVDSGSWSRSSDADSDTEVTSGLFTFVSEGDTHADSGWVLTTNDTIVLNTTSLSFAQFSGAGQITAGGGLTKNGNTIDAVGTAGRIVVNADSIDLDTVTQTDSTGPDGLSFVQGVGRDAYGRVSGVITSTVQDASTSVKGVARFDSDDFAVDNGLVSIKPSGIDNTQLVNDSLTIGSTNIVLGDTATSLSGLSVVTSTDFVGALSGNASTATALQTARTINGTSFDGTQNIVIAFIDGGTP